MVLTYLEMLQNLEDFMNKQPNFVKQIGENMADEVVISEKYEIKPVEPIEDGYKVVTTYPYTEMTIMHFNNDGKYKQKPEYVFDDYYDDDTNKLIAKKLKEITEVLRSLAKKSNKANQSK